MAAKNSQGCLTGCLPGLLALFGVLMIFTGIGIWGISIGIIMAVLIWFSPEYRTWLGQQRGYRFRLARLPGLADPENRDTAIWILLYTVPWSLAYWAFLLSNDGEVFLSAGTGEEAVLVIVGYLLGTVITIPFMYAYFVSGKLGLGSGTDSPPISGLDRFRSVQGELDDLKDMDPIEFENYIGSMFRHLGYDVRTTVTSGDEGVDLFVQKGARKGVVQCKRLLDGTVGQPVVRDLFGTMIHNDADEAYLFTTGLISLPARNWAEGKPIYLADGAKLVEWIRRIKARAESETSTVQQPKITPTERFGISRALSVASVHPIALLALVVAVFLPFPLFGYAGFALSANQGIAVATDVPSTEIEASRESAESTPTAEPTETIAAPADAAINARFTELSISEVHYDGELVRVRGETDLPTGAVVDVTFDIAEYPDPNAFYVGLSHQVTVISGEFTTSFEPPAIPEYEEGPYEVEVRFLPNGTLGKSQADAISEQVGLNGEFLGGNQATELDNGMRILLDAKVVDLQLVLVPPSYPQLDPLEFASSSPQRALAEYLVAWQAMDWERMAQFTQGTWQEVWVEEPALELAYMYDFKTLLGAEIVGLEVVQEGVSVAIEAILYYSLSPTNVKKVRIEAMVLRESEPYTLSKTGVWGVNPISTLGEEDIE